MDKLLYAGVIGPPLFIIVFITEGLTRPGYSAWRNYVSQLATGPGGWVQVVNFFVFGTLVLCFALGLRMAIKGKPGSIGGPILMGLFGVALLIAGAFVTDPGLGYPVGARQVHTAHGVIHALAGLAAFSLLAAASFVMAWHFGSEAGSRRWTLYSLAVGTLIVVFFIASQAAAAGDASGVSPSDPTGFFQRIAIIGGWTWITAVALHLLRSRQAPPKARSRQDR
jgi:hypothetical protein